MTDTSAIATFGAGCFWCVEAVFKELQGVRSVASGYTGGSVKNPTYEQVCSGRTGHAEAVQICFDPEIISFADLLTVFWRIHDPTTLNRQGNDVGTQYRSVIFFHDEGQRQIAETSKGEIEAAGLYSTALVTTLEPAGHFYPAENYHDDYFARNPQQSYCRLVIDPKVRKFRKQFKDKLAD